jgi:peroxiredoxin
MKQMILSLTALLATSLFAAAQVQSGKPAPDFTVKDIDGKTHNLSDYKGKILVLESYNLDCPFVVNHYKSGAMQELQAKAKEQGAVWLLVNSTHAKNSSYRTSAAAKKEITQQKIAATAWLDDNEGNLGRAYGMRTTPHMFVIDANGILVYQGAIDDRAADSGDPRQARNYVRETLEALAAGKPVEVAQTKPYGCGVKYR